MISIVEVYLNSRDSPVSVATSPDGAHVYVTNQMEDTVSVISIVPASAN